MTLRATLRGKGPDLLLLHGWGMHCGVFDGIADALADKRRVHFIDLPGHGLNARTELPADIDDVAQQVLDAAPLRAQWLGWSLGGMVAMAAAMRAPQRVTRLIAVASTPKFVAASDWPRAVSVASVKTMAADLRADLPDAVKHFLTLQALGDQHAQCVLRVLRKNLDAHGKLDRTSLANGLRILQEADLRPRLHELAVPFLTIMGDRDRLIPSEVGDTLARTAADGKSVSVAGAAHAPFISDPAGFLAAAFAFLDSR